jgi:hypothetical protein
MTINNIFVDWGITKQHIALIEEEKPNKEVKSICYFKFSSVEEMFDSIKKPNEIIKSKETIIFMESGCPHKFLWRLLEKGCQIYVCQGQLVKEIRDDREKSDENDVKFIKELHDKNFSAFRELTLPEKDDIKLSYLMAKYQHFMKDCVRFKNRQKAYEKEFGKSETYTKIISQLKKEKKKCLSEVEPLIKEVFNRVYTKGLGIRYVAGLLAAANPKKFKTLSAYLHYCGYKDYAGTKYNREAKTLAFQCAESFIKHNNPKYRELYDEIKKDKQTKFPDATKGKIHGVTMNKVATFFLKDFYNNLNGKRD